MTSPLSPNKTLRSVPTLIVVVVLLPLLLVGSSAMGRDLDAHSDGEHLWLVKPDVREAKGDEDEDTPVLQVYHHHKDAETGRTDKPEPIVGELMPGGTAAGDGKLLLVLDDRRLVLMQPEWNPLQLRWGHDKRSLPALPEGCSLEALALGTQGPWALVRVESEDFLKALEKDTAEVLGEAGERAALNQALGLPEDFDLGMGEEKSEEKQEPSKKQEKEEDKDKPAEDDPEAESDTGSETGKNKTEKNDGPAYRLIHLSGTSWVNVPLPETFLAPRHAVLLLREGEGRPTIIIQPEEPAAGIGLTQYFPFKPIGDETTPAEDKPDEEKGETAGDTWRVKRLPSRPLRSGLWSAVLVDRQVVLVVERSRSIERIATAAYVLRGERALPIGDLSISTSEPARWSAVAWRGGVGIVTSPGPPTQPQEGSKNQVVGGLTAISLSGTPILNQDDDPESKVLVLYHAEPSTLQQNADLIIQITTFTLAMLLMVMFFKRVPRPDQLQLPEHLVLGGLGRRMIAGMIDLAPGFWVAGLMYETTVSDTMLFWPGNGISKALPAMRPGFIVITVTLIHTTFFELITARTPGKWFTGLYVIDVEGKPATPSASLNRSVARVFDLFAPLLLIFIFITPARQRLGDVLARTIVVMRKPRPIGEEDEPGGSDE